MTNLAYKLMLRSLTGDLKQSVRLYFSPLRAVTRDFERSMDWLSHESADDASRLEKAPDETDPHEATN